MWVFHIVYRYSLNFEHSKLFKFPFLMSIDWVAPFQQLIFSESAVCSVYTNGILFNMYYFGWLIWCENLVALITPTYRTNNIEISLIVYVPCWKVSLGRWCFGMIIESFLKSDLALISISDEFITFSDFRPHTAVVKSFTIDII